MKIIFKGGYKFTSMTIIDGVVHIPKDWKLEKGSYIVEIKEDIPKQSKWQRTLEIEKKVDELEKDVDYMKSDRYERRLTNKVYKKQKNNIDYFKSKYHSKVEIEERVREIIKEELNKCKGNLISMAGNQFYAFIPPNPEIDKNKPH